MEDQEKDQLLNQILERLKKLEENLKQIQKRVERFETRQPPRREQTNQLNAQTIFEIDLMNLPDNLRKTVLALVQLGEASPEEVAERTNRTRGLENIYLNQLERLGYIEKSKKGRRVYYRSLRTR